MTQLPSFVLRTLFVLQGKKSLTTFISKVVSVLKLNKINTTVAGSTYHDALGNCLLWQGLVRLTWLDKSSLLTAHALLQSQRG